MKLWLPLFCWINCSVVAIGAQQKPADGPSTAVGAKVTPVNMTDVTGKTWTLAELQAGVPGGKKRAVVLMFWCSTCHSCRSEEANFDTFAKAYKDKAVIAALSVNRGETAQSGTAFVQKKGMSFPVVYDASGKATGTFGAKSTTLVVLIDADGVLRYRGPLKQNGINYTEDALKSVLAGKVVENKEVKDESG